MSDPRICLLQANCKLQSLEERIQQLESLMGLTQYRVRGHGENDSAELVIEAPTHQDAAEIWAESGRSESRSCEVTGPDGITHRYLLNTRITASLIWRSSSGRAADL